MAVGPGDGCQMAMPAGTDGKARGPAGPRNRHRVAAIE